jgi:hypothetical protein
MIHKQKPYSIFPLTLVEMIRRETSMPPCATVYYGSKDIDGGGLGHIISVCFGTTASGTTTSKKINISCNAPAIKSVHKVAIFSGANNLSFP